MNREQELENAVKVAIWHMEQTTLRDGRGHLRRALEILNDVLAEQVAQVDTEPCKTCGGTKRVPLSFDDDAGWVGTTDMGLEFGAAWRGGTKPCPDCAGDDTERNE